MTYSGLAAHLETDRATLWRYSDGEHGDEFRNPLKAVMSRIEADKAEKALTGKYNATFAIFDLKNNHGWSDKREVESTNTNKTEHSFDPESVEQAIESVADRLNAIRS